MSAAASPNLPTADQRRLLHVILGPEAECVDRWREWQRHVRLDDLDAGSVRLLPMLWHVLEPRRIAGPDVQRYQGIARKVWYEMQLTFHHLGGLLAAWRQTGRPIALLKGGALAQRYYPSPALRPMDDADLLVTREDAIAAIEWFTDRGWTSLLGHSRERLTRYTLHKMHSADLEDPAGRAVDLHWDLFNLPIPPACTAEVWAAMEPLRLGAAEVLTPCATDHLLHACVHGVFWNRLPALRWVVDASLILRRAGDRIDWARFVRLTDAMHVGHFVGPAIAFLREEFAAPIPADVAARIAALPVAPWQRDEYRVLTTPNDHLWRDYIAKYRLPRLRVVSPDWSRRRPWRARMDYHKLLREIDSDRQLALLALRRVGRLVRPGPGQPARA